MSSILIIDDEPYVRETLCRVLRKQADVITAVPDAEEGLRRLGCEGADLVITDIILPNMDGIEAIRRIARDHPAVRIIAMSGGGSLELEGYRPAGINTCAYLEAARQAGAHGVLRKPFGLKQLRASIEQLLRAVPEVA